MKLNVLGTEYSITVKKYDEDEYFKRADCNGYCSQSLKEIVVCDMATYPGWEHEPQETMDINKRSTLRHEIVHAFFNESGLSCNSNSVDMWARNEEMVDWFALQGPKIYMAWQAAGAL
ncbi:hypothetical protein [Acutalibacter muris]|uniref:hypothetical protein n=1 Tax=Acutalibacter muris TaxID=1796620 RepID=UPI00272E9CF1|nr:hypothetical protein [Acutalibacter muris]